VISGDSSEQDREDVPTCCHCGRPGRLVLCDRVKCGRAFHLTCISVRRLPHGSHFFVAVNSLPVVALCCCCIPTTAFLKITRCHPYHWQPMECCNYCPCRSVCIDYMTFQLNDVDHLDAVCISLQPA